MSRLSQLGCAIATVLVVAATLAPVASALRIPPEAIEFELLDGTGAAENRAASHPYRLLLGFEFEADAGAGEEDVKEIVIDLPTGLAGSPAAVPLCPREVFAEIFRTNEPCPAESEVGKLVGNGTQTIASIGSTPNEPASFGAYFPVSILKTGLRSTDQGLRLRVVGVPQSGAPLRKGEIELWGVPADHQAGTDIPRKPLLTLPTRCDQGPLVATVSVRTWQAPDTWVSGAGSTGVPLTGCDGLPFDPSAGLALTSSAPDSPTGAAFSFSVPQNEDPDGRVSSMMRKVEMALPNGMAISAAGAAGLAACSDAQLDLGGESDPSCPPASRVGKVEIATPQALKPLEGSVYLGAERPGDRFRLFIVAAGSGAQMKAVGSLRPDPVTGRLQVDISDLPQAALSQMTLSFDGGPGALLSTPLACGPAVLSTTFVPYSGTAPVTRSATQSIDCAGATPFSPGFVAGTLSTGAGAPAAFTATMTRRDGEGLPERLEIAFPPGLAAALGSLTPCSDAAARASACPSSARIGSALAELGPGEATARLAGDLFLTGPYKGAPFGLAIAFGARLGPFDLGALTIRGTIEVDPETGQVSVRTDPLPRQIEGIPVRLRTLGLDIDRPGFLRNPTSCSPAQVSAEIRSTEGAKTKSSSPFRARNCIGLRFQPSFGLALSKRSELRRGGRPALAISGKLPRGNANLRRVELDLPALLKLDSSAIAAICSRAEAERRRCPKGSVVGEAEGRTPMLSGPLKGKVFAVQPKGGGTPDVWATLSGQGIDILLKGETVIRKGRVTAKLTELPDFPLASFSLAFSGGPHGLFALKRSPCARRLRAPLAVEGQNRALREGGARVSTSCG